MALVFYRRLELGHCDVDYAVGYFCALYPTLIYVSLYVSLHNMGKHRNDKETVILLAFVIMSFCFLKSRTGWF
jgi:hypothetical protein